MFLALPSNNRLGWKLLASTNALAYNTAVLITTVKKLKVEVHTNVSFLNQVGTAFLQNIFSTRQLD
jgi:hypothetical protein